jgi:hypothetical protein
MEHQLWKAIVAVLAELDKPVTPAWVRTHRRVRLWVQAKLVLARLKRDAELTTCAA